MGQAHGVKRTATSQPDHEVQRGARGTGVTVAFPACRRRSGEVVREEINPTLHVQSCLWDREVTAPASRGHESRSDQE